MKNVWLLCLVVLIAPALWGQSDYYTPSDKASLKSPRVAVNRAIGHTLAPALVGYYILENSSTPSEYLAGWTILTFGSIFGPSSGNLYAKDGKRGYTGIAIRSLSAAFFFFSAEALFREGQSGADHELMVTLLYGNFFLLIGSAAWNIQSAPASVREYNERYFQRYSITPLINPERKMAGLQLSLRF